MISLPHKNVAVAPLYDTLKIGSLYIPEQSRERCDQGIVKYVGSECELVKQGDHVIFSGFTGTNIRIDDELLIILPEEFVCAIIEYDQAEVARIEIPGLYFRGVEGEYFPATYEMAMTLIARGFEESQLWIELSASRAGVKKAHTQRPKVADYER